MNEILDQEQDFVPSKKKKEKINILKDRFFDLHNQPDLLITNENI